MTEDEAKTKWCPFVRMAKAHGNDVPHGQAVFNRVSLDGGWGMPDAALCIGAQCMAWRRQFAVLDELGFRQDAPAGSGFCGLAGRPE